jgi:hypothetical protein
MGNEWKLRKERNERAIEGSKITREGQKKKVSVLLKGTSFVMFENAT